MKEIFFYSMALALFTSCSSTKFTSNYDGDIDFNQHKTLSYYGWTEESDKILTRFDKDRIEKAFGDEFEKRGFTLAERDGDIIVSLFIVVDQKKGATAYTNHYGGGGPYGYGGYGYGAGWGWGGGYSSTSYSEYDYYVGTLVCDVLDSKTKKLIWQGVITGEIDDNPKTRERNTPRVVKEIMKKYPKQPLKEKK
jgi:hypothetical protein